MPKDILNEDMWVTLVIGDDNWTTEDNAKVYFRPYSWEEQERMTHRYLKAEEQIERQYPDLAKRCFYNKGFIKTLKMRWQKLKYCDGIIDKTLFTIGFLLRNYKRLKVKRGMNPEQLQNYLDAWEISEDSKKPIHMHTS